MASAWTPGEITGVADVGGRLGVVLGGDLGRLWWPEVGAGPRQKPSEESPVKKTRVSRR